LTVRLFVDKRIITAEPDGRLHKAVSKLCQDVGKGNSNISSKKTEIITLTADESVNPLMPNKLEIRRAVSPLKIKIPSKNMREKPTNTPIIHSVY
jgi:hypothetical protein